MASSISLARPLLILALASPAFAGGARIVEPTGTQNFATIGAAVAAAVDGDVILVGGGTYPGFTITAKSVSIHAVPGADVAVVSPVAIASLAADQTVVLAGIHVDLPDPATSTPALSITNCAGTVRIERCAFRSADYFTWLCGTLQPGAPGVLVTGSPRVAFQSTQTKGGRGEGLDPFEFPLCAPAAPGGAGLVANTSTVALYDCTILGGQGGPSEGTIGRGGPGLALGAATVFTSNGWIEGGRGGTSLLQIPGAHGAQGGDAVTFAAASTLYDVSGAFVPGGGGAGSGGAGPSGANFVGGAPIALAGPARIASVTPLVQADLSTAAVSYHGGVGEQALMLGSLAPAFALSPVVHGTWLVQRSMLLPIVALGATDGQGNLAATLAIPDLPAGSLLQRRHLQSAVRSQGMIWLGSQASTVILDRDSGPDCDGNGVSDFVDVVLGTVSDANHNLIPDSCPGG